MDLNHILLTTSSIPPRRSAVTRVTEYVSKEEPKFKRPLVPAVTKQDVGSTLLQGNPALLLKLGKRNCYKWSLQQSKFF